jgi:hypothetical protein
VLVSVLGNVVGVVILLGAALVAFRWLNTGRPPRLLRPLVDWFVARAARRRPAHEPLPPVLLGLELRRMGEHMRQVEAGDQPSKAERLAVCRLAYDQVLREYCRSVGIPAPPGSGSLTPEERFAMESDLISEGYDW